MLLLGIDLGTSSIKVAVTDADTRRVVAFAQYPETEAAILSRQPGWAEQSPDTWWEYVQQAIHAAHATGKYAPIGYPPPSASPTRCMAWSLSTNPKKY